MLNVEFFRRRRFSAAVAPLSTIAIRAVGTKLTVAAGLLIVAGAAPQ